MDTFPICTRADRVQACGLAWYGQICSCAHDLNFLSSLLYPISLCLKKNRNLSKSLDTKTLKGNQKGLSNNHQVEDKIGFDTLERFKIKYRALQQYFQ